jgi:hypothetical protein
MTTSTDNRAVIEELDAAALSRIAGGMSAVYDDGSGNKARPGPPPEGSFGGLDQPYWASSESMRYGAGPWDYGYGSPTGPWP